MRIPEPTMRETAARLINGLRATGEYDAVMECLRDRLDAGAADVEAYVLRMVSESPTTAPELVREIQSAINSVRRQ